VPARPWPFSRLRQKGESAQIAAGRLNIEPHSDYLPATRPGRYRIFGFAPRCGRIGGLGPRGSAHWDPAVAFLLRISRAIDALNEAIGHLVYWAVLAAVLVSAGNASVRYALDTSSNAWLELQWYLFSAVFLLCSGYTLLHNQHVRIDVVHGHLPRRVRAWIDLLGSLLFLLPMAIVIMVLSWPLVVDSYARHEYSSDAGGLLRWPVKLLIPVGFLLLAAQGVSEIIKRAAFLLGRIGDPLEKHEEPVAEELMRGGAE
jgi:TRAP-type mannitol/chloroaromatic compound transport system permease small subunit